MRACAWLAFSVMIGLLSTGLSFQETERDFVLDDVVSLEYRDLVPGEVIKVSIKNLALIRSAQVRFLDKKYDMAKIGSRLVCLIGLDLGIDTGIYPLKAYVYKQDGTVEIKEQDISVNPKQFPVKKLWVREEFVTPPENVLERIQREAELTQAVYDIYSPEWKAEGKFVIPVQGQIFPNFGERRFFNNKPRSQHSGVDIASPKGTPVKASNSGRVVLANHLYFAGNTVIIDHGLGVFSVYCHFSEITVNRGEEVEKGDIVGKIGSTGRVTGPHLHWSVRIRGSRVDPNALLSLEFE
jgi:hypothetical protein